MSSPIVGGATPAGGDPVLDRLATEGRLPEAAEVDRLSTADQLALLSTQDRRAVEAVADAHPAIAAVIDAAVPRMRRGGRLIEVGAGTPGRLAVLDASECRPTFGIDTGRVVAVIAGGLGAVVESVEAAEDDDGAGFRDVSALDLSPDDVVVAVSASGRTPYLLGAARAAADAGALRVAVVNNAGSALAAACDIAVETLTGPEVVAGSTRLKAGTAQKLVLNAISTLTMIQLGHTYGDLMVDVRATNEKLRNRATRIVAEATGATPDAVAAALSASDGEAKVAVIMLLTGADADEARTRLAAAHGMVRDAVAPR